VRARIAAMSRADLAQRSRARQFPGVAEDGRWPRL